MFDLELEGHAIIRHSPEGPGTNPNWDCKISSYMGMAHQSIQRASEAMAGCCTMAWMAWMRAVLVRTAAFSALLERLRDYADQHHRDHWCVCGALNAHMLWWWWLGRPLPLQQACHDGAEVRPRTHVCRAYLIEAVPLIN